MGSIDLSVEPAIIISADANPYFQTRRYSESDFDSRTLLDYLNLSAIDELDTAVPVQILSTGQETADSDSPQVVDHEEKQEMCHAKHHVNFYNVSVESGVVMDSDPHISVRKISNGSSNFSHGSLSYIGTGNTVVCTCSECKLRRERIHSANSGYGTLECMLQSNEHDEHLLDDLTTSDTDLNEKYCHMNGNIEPPSRSGPDRTTSHDRTEQILHDNVEHTDQTLGSQLTQASSVK